MAIIRLSLCSLGGILFSFKTVTGFSTIIMESTVIFTALELSDLLSFPLISVFLFRIYFSKSQKNPQL